MEDKIIPMEQAYDHIMSELICINCKQRFIDIRPFHLYLKDLECPQCSEKGYLIETGEVIPNITYEKALKDNPGFTIYRQYHSVYTFDNNLPD